MVAGAIVRDGRVLATRRRRPPALAGWWEFPGGKVEAGESETAALGRELYEELAIRAQIGALLGRVALSPTRELALYLCASFTGDLRLGDDHDALRWLAEPELGDVAWLEADRALLDRVSGTLGTPGAAV